MGVSCNVCRKLGDQVSWGNGGGEMPYKVLEKLKTLSETERQCPSCNAHFLYSITYEHAADHYMPDTTETLTRVKSPCDLCESLGDEVSWGNASFAKLYDEPRAAQELKRLDEDMRECPRCGAWFQFTWETEHAADHYMPDNCWKLTRVK